MKVQTIGVIDFGPVDNGDPGPGNSSARALMLLPKDREIDFVTIPQAVLVSGQAVWTANQMSDNSEIFIYVPTGKCLSRHGQRRAPRPHALRSWPTPSVGVR